MTRLFLLFVGFLFCLCCSAQTTIRFGEKYSSTLVAQIPLNDSLNVYQCHVEEGTQTTVTNKGQVIEGKKQSYSITEKFVLLHTPEGYKLKYYTSSLTVFPNRKFSGLKKKERKYWNFKFEKEVLLNEHDVLVFAAAELLGKETTEYDFAITKYTTNQIIFNTKREFKQMVFDTRVTLRQSLSCFK
jgi:hypothetical protein